MSDSRIPENSANLAEIEPWVIQIAHASGRILMDLKGHVVPQEKGVRDLVTAADHASQSQIQAEIARRFPDHIFVGEESPELGTAWRFGLAWMVDPLDGTLNFVHGLPGFSVSIALCRDSRPLLGVVYDPWLDETYSAFSGGGARCNGQPIAPSGCNDLGRALFVHSLPSVVTADHLELRRFTAMVQRCSTRRLGSAALNLCYVAQGRLDGYWASTLKPWDIAAGALIAQEAGAHCGNLSGGPLDLADPRMLVTSTPSLATQALALLDIGDQVD